MKDFGNGLYALSDNGWQSAFPVTDAGVIVFDAPASYGKHIPEAVTKVTKQPIKMLIYSHLHKDHIGGSIAFKSIPGLQIIALDTVSDFLKEMKDPNRLIPTVDQDLLAKYETATCHRKCVERLRSKNGSPSN